MPVISRQAYGNGPGWSGFYCQFVVNPVMGKRAAAAATGTENDRNLAMFGGYGAVPAITLEHNPIGAGQTLLAPVVTAAGLNLGSQDQADNEGMQFHTGGEASGVGATQFVVGETAFYALFLDIVIEDVTGTDDLAFGIREVEAVQAALDNFTDLACFNIISGDIKTETILADAATVTTDSGQDWADTAKKSLLLRVDAAGAVTYFISTDAAFDANGQRLPQTWTALPNAVAYSFADGITVGPFIYCLQTGDIMGAVTIRAIEFGVG